MCLSVMTSAALPPPSCTTVTVFTASLLWCSLTFHSSFLSRLFTFPPSATSFLYFLCISLPCPCDPSFSLIYRLQQTWDTAAQTVTRGHQPRLPWPLPLLLWPSKQSKIHLTSSLCSLLNLKYPVVLWPHWFIRGTREVFFHIVIDAKSSAEMHLTTWKILARFVQTLRGCTRFQIMWLLYGTAGLNAPLSASLLLQNCHILQMLFSYSVVSLVFKKKKEKKWYYGIVGIAFIFAFLLLSSIKEMETKVLSERMPQGWDSYLECAEVTNTSNVKNVKRILKASYYSIFGLPRCLQDAFVWFTTDHLVTLLPSIKDPNSNKVINWNWGSADLLTLN